MKDPIKDFILYFLGYIPLTLGIIGCIYVGIYCRFFIEPDVSEARLFLNHWDTILLSLFLIFVSWMVLDKCR